MNRARCEAKIMEHMEAIVDILHEYAPECKYLSLSYIQGTGGAHLCASNAYFAEDKKKPIDCFKIGSDPLHSFPLK